jgi:hypothetical protein
MNSHLIQAMAQQRQHDMIEAAAAQNVARGAGTRRRHKLFSSGWTFRRSAPDRAPEAQLKPQATG